MMVRPFALVGFTYLLTLTAAVYFGAEIAAVLGCACLAAFCVLALVFRGGKRVLLAALVVSALAFGSFCAYDRAVVAPAAALDNQDAFLTGTVCELPYRQNGRFYYILQVDRIEQKDAPYVEKVRVSSQHALDTDIYGKIRAKVHFYLPRGGEGETSRSYYASKGITLFAYFYEYEDMQTWPTVEKPPYYYALSLRRRMMNAVLDMLPQKEAGLINGILLGDKHGLDPQIQQDFRTAGVSHLLSVSGLHLAIMAQFLLLLLERLRLGRRAASLLAMVGVLVFMALTGFVPSVMRSGIMYLIFLLGRALWRDSDSLNSLGIAVTILGVANPYAAADVGLMLSSLATLGLILFSNRIYNWFGEKYRGAPFGKRILDFINSSVSSTLSSTVLTTFVITLSFGSVSVIGLVSNLLMVVPASLLMVLALLASSLYLTGLAFVAMPLALLAGLLAKYLTACAALLSSVPFASLPASFGFVKLWLAAVVLLFAVAWAGRAKKPRTAAVLSLVLLLTGVLTYQFSLRGVTRVAVMDSGDGISVVLTQDGQSAMIGCGESAVSAEWYLRTENIKSLQYLQMAGETQEEIESAAKQIAAFSPERALLRKDISETGELQKSIGSIGTLDVFQERAAVSLWENVKIETVSTGAQQYLGLEINGCRILLCSERCDGQTLPPKWQQADFAVMSSIPKNGEAVQPIMAVLAMWEDTALKSLPSAGRISNAVCLTDPEGGLIIDIAKDGAIKMRRDR